MDGVIEKLRENDPARTRIDIRLYDDESSDADLAQALEQNAFITEINLGLEGEQRVDWNHLLRVIATRANLETVKLWDSFVRRNVSAALIRSILLAMQQNTAIQHVEMWLATSSH